MFSCYVNTWSAFHQVLAAVSAHGPTLQFASDELRDDDRVVRAACENDGMSLRFASLRLKGDKTTVLKAVRSKGQALNYAAEALKGDFEVIKTALDCSSGRHLGTIKALAILNEKKNRR